MDELSTMEKYALAQLLVCGRINYNEFCSANSFLAEVRTDTIGSLQRKGYLEQLLFDDRKVI